MLESESVEQMRQRLVNEAKEFPGKTFFDDDSMESSCDAIVLQKCSMEMLDLFFSEWTRKGYRPEEISCMIGAGIDVLCRKHDRKLDRGRCQTSKRKRF